MWRLWKNINDYAFSGKDYNAPTTVQKVWEDVMEWRNRVEVNEEEVKKPMIEVPQVKWISPAPYFLKCNTYGSWTKEIGAGGVRWILRKCEY